MSNDATDHADAIAKTKIAESLWQMGAAMHRYVDVYEKEINHKYYIPTTKPSSWQPIATAPTDGSDFLAYIPSIPWPQIRIVHYITLQHPNNFIWATPVRRGGLSDHFRENDPTHWMPLPAPPLV